MVLTTGAKLGPYEIIAPLGAGGMGEVYRARDTRLDRTVAIKVLPSHLSNNSEARQRFEREARAISALNHPNICTLFDVGHQDGVDFLVMEFLEGETLSNRLLRGPLPIDKLLKYGQEICSALQKAHQSGVVHRDLKPSNIMLAKSGAKLMDFGLAKSSVSPAPELSSVTVSLSTPAAERPLTAEGSLVGTFQYMSPEQLEGTEADARSDIFALGAVLYEMVTGKRAFAGKTIASLIAAVMTTEPQPVLAIQPLSPPALDRVIKTCLAKDPDQRFQNVHDVNLQLRWISEGGSQAGVPAPVSAHRKTREHVAWGLAAVALLVAVLVAFVHFRESTPEARVVRSTIQPPESGGFAEAYSMPGTAVLSPDARNIAFITTVAVFSQLWIRPLDSFTSRALPGTEHAYGAFWSPDGRSLGFFAQGKLKRVSVTGGPVSTVCDVIAARGASWNRQDVIIFAKLPGGIYRVPASGGVPQAVTQLDSLHEVTHRWPYFLPDGNHFLYMGDVSGRASDENVFKVGSLDGKTDRILFHASSPMAYDSGYLLFMINDKLMARRFDSEKMEFSGDPVAVAEDVQFDPMNTNGVFSASGTGALLYEAGNASNQRKIEMLDARGSLIETLSDPGRVFDLRISPDGKRVAYSLADETTGKRDIWVYEIATGNRIRITRDPRSSRGPLWSHDGTRIAYTSGRVQARFVTYYMPANGMGEEQELWAPQGSGQGLGWRGDWTPDSKALVVDEPTETGKARISMALIGGKGQTVPLLETPGANVGGSRLSADGRLIAYMSDQSGKSEVYVSGFPVPGGRLQVSSNGGRFPRWRGDGREVYYFLPDTDAVKVVAAELNVINGAVEVTRRRTLFQIKPLVSDFSWDVFPDGKRFLITVPKNDTPVPLSLVLNWSADLKK